ncbi:MAG TPA: hypothetical protein VIH42_11280 [Thermoguttaceae bacterium]
MPKILIESRAVTRRKGLRNHILNCHCDPLVAAELDEFFPQRRRNIQQVANIVQGICDLLLGERPGVPIRKS